MGKSVETATPLAPGTVSKEKADPEQALDNESNASSEYTYEPGFVTKKRCCWCCIVLVLIAGVICALYFTIGPEKAVEIVRGTKKSQGEILQLLLPYTPEEILLDESTPQGQALQLLVSEVEESGGEPIPHRILQRYGLMVLYTSTNSSGWTTDDGWKTFTEDECEWFGIGACDLLEDGNNAVTNIELGTSQLALTRCIEPTIV